MAITKQEMKDIIDIENGDGFHRNVDLNGFNFIKNRTFSCFKIYRLMNVNSVIISYIHMESKAELMSLLAYSTNFWMGKRVKFIYFMQKENSYSKELFSELRKLGFKVMTRDHLPDDFKYSYDCLEDSFECECQIYEAHT